MNVTIDIDKDQVIDTLARTTGYIGAKSLDADNGAYQRIALNEGDAKLIERFFGECCDHLGNALRRQMESETVIGRIYKIALTLSSAFDQQLIDSVRNAITNYFVQAIASKWLSITDKSQAEEYARAASATLDYLVRKIYHKRPPERPSYQ